MGNSTAAITIRTAEPGEAAVITGHRRAMFAEIRPTPEERLDAMAAAFEPWLEERMGRGEYQGWLAVTPEGEVVGGAGVWVMDWPPDTVSFEPRRANILNVYVAPGYRRRGLARALTQAALDWCQQQRVRIVILHASEAGRPVYTGLGFAPTNEMRVTLDLAKPSAGAA